MKIKKTVYTQPPEIAREKGELDRYHESYNLNQQCAAAIHKAITESNYAPNHYDLESAARKMFDEYGHKRVMWVLSNTIQRSYNDGRYSRSNQEWAKGFDIPAEPGRYYSVRSHPCLVDGFIDAARIMLKEREKAAALARAEKREAKCSAAEPPQEDRKASSTGYELAAVTNEETVLFYSVRNPGRDLETGCIGHFRMDFGRDGKGFYNSWEDHNSSLKTQTFKDEFDNVINTLRDNGILKDRSAMAAHCNSHPQAKLDDGRDYNYGFKIKTESHVYYLRCCSLTNDYNLYCYVYERGRLEKCFPSLAPTAKPTLMERLAENKQKAARQEHPKNHKSKEQEV